MTIVPPTPRGRRRVVTIGERPKPQRPTYYRHLPHQGRGIGALATEWDVVLRHIATCVHAAESIELGERAALQLLRGQDIHAALYAAHTAPGPVRST